MQNVFVRPVRRNAAGALVHASDPAFDQATPVHLRDPASGKPLDPAGEWKPLNDFWARRIAQDDVEECVAPSAKTLAGASIKPVDVAAIEASLAAFHPAAPKK